ncbi:MAG TPA: hypothetical protein VFT31_01860 [Kribbella sp.]|nr:hypothetical protein [Kribbella sp.]
MKHISTLVAVPVLTCGAVVVGASQASATTVDPEPGAHGEGFAVVYTPGPTVKVDDTIAEALQTGAGAIGGAGIAVAALWVYRRRHPISVH